MNVQPEATSNIDDIVLRDRDTTGSGTLDERLYSMQDANWNVVVVATPAAVMQERYAYSPYGVPVFLTGTFTARTSSNFNWERLFTGQTYDTQTGLHYFRNRMLHSQVGTFITRDPIGYADGVNLYRYALNSPASLSDPYGTAAAVLLPPTWLLYLLAIAAGVSLTTIISILLALLAAGIVLYAAVELIRRHGRDNPDFDDLLRRRPDRKPKPKPKTDPDPDIPVPPFDPRDICDRSCKKFPSVITCAELKKDKYYQTEIRLGSRPDSLCPDGYKAVNPETPEDGPCANHPMGTHYTCKNDAGKVGPGIGCCTCCEDVNNEATFKEYCGELPSNPK